MSLWFVDYVERPGQVAKHEVQCTRLSTQWQSPMRTDLTEHPRKLGGLGSLYWEDGTTCYHTPTHAFVFIGKILTRIKCWRCTLEDLAQVSTFYPLLFNVLRG